MIRYMLLEGEGGEITAITDREEGITFSVTHERRYQKYLNWLDDGNTAIPSQPSPAHVLDANDQWVIDPVAQEAINKKELMFQLRGRDIKLFVFLLTLWEVLVTKGVVTNQDLPEDIRQEAADWKQKLIDLGEL